MANLLNCYNKKEEDLFDIFFQVFLKMEKKSNTFAMRMCNVQIT